jgi:predicted nucleic acid-binding protein
MTGAPLILDADGLDALTEQPPPDRLRALLTEAWERKSDVLVPALVVPTDFDLARRVGLVLHGVGADTKDVIDAHSVAVASMYGRAVVVTADPDDILRLASAMPAVRIVTRSAR